MTLGEVTAGGGTVERCEEHACCLRASGVLAVPGFEHLAGVWHLEWMPDDSAWFLLQPRGNISEIRVLGGADPPGELAVEGALFDDIRAEIARAGPLPRPADPCSRLPRGRSAPPSHEDDHHDDDHDQNERSPREEIVVTGVACVLASVRSAAIGTSVRNLLIPDLHDRYVRYSPLVPGWQGPEPRTDDFPLRPIGEKMQAWPRTP